jgi:hypothetical protein
MSTTVGNTETSGPVSTLVAARLLTRPVSVVLYTVQSSHYRCVEAV